MPHTQSIRLMSEEELWKHIKGSMDSIHEDREEAKRSTKPYAFLPSDLSIQRVQPFFDELVFRVRYGVTLAKREPEKEARS